VTRRELLVSSSFAGFQRVVSPAKLVIPIHQVWDRRAKSTPEQLRRYSSAIWPEAVRDFNAAGIQLQSTSVSGDIKRSPSGRPLFVGLAGGTLNLVLTDVIPLAWDNARGLAGVTTRYDGYHLCVIALQYAHTHQVPFLSVNTCVHELLHAMLQDIFESRPNGFSGHTREFRIDAYATRLWLFHDGAYIRESARVYLSRLQSGAGTVSRG
jgi:hypothetical protein